jgi:hypothetical protein
MKLTKQELVEIIKEELDNILLEGEPLHLPANLSRTTGRYTPGLSTPTLARFASQLASDEAAEKGVPMALARAGGEGALGRLAKGAAGTAARGLGVAAAPMLAYDIGQGFEDLHKHNLETGETEPTVLDWLRSAPIRKDIERGGPTLDPKYAEAGWKAAKAQEEADPESPRRTMAQAGGHILDFADSAAEAVWPGNWPRFYRELTGTERPSDY